MQIINHNSHFPKRYLFDQQKQVQAAINALSSPSSVVTMAEEGEDHSFSGFFS